MIIEESYHRLFPEKEFPYRAELEYNRRLADFNANIKLSRNTLKVCLNLQWKDIDREIKIGVIQHLLLKILKKRQDTPNINLYNNFIRNIPLLIPKTKTEPLLESAFHKINGQFFEKSMEQPNLKWGQPSFRKLASYNFHNDTITVSSLFTDAPQRILEYLLYHEMLHKHHQFQHRNGRSSYHSTAFRRDEAKFPNQQEVEKELSRIAGRKPFWRSFLRNL